jgi:MoaA/NifB/PqqE/SkfB family radical SAM enzyme
MAPQEFHQLLDRMLQDGLIDPSTKIHLYNWGEPFLHPQLSEILDIISGMSFSFILSTNGCRPLITWKQTWTEHLYNLKFSMSGFSQESYDRIHKLNFTQVVSNIEAIVRAMREAGATAEQILSKCYVELHVYQFNLKELSPCEKWCESIGIRYTQILAVINDLVRAYKYLVNKNDNDTVYRASQDLFLHYVHKLVKQQPTDWKCPQHNMLIVDEYLKVLTCCGLYKNHGDYALGSAMKLSKSDIDRLRCKKKICRLCLGAGLSYWGHNPLSEP